MLETEVVAVAVPSLNRGWGINLTRPKNSRVIILNGKVNEGHLKVFAHQTPKLFIITLVRADKIIMAIAHHQFQPPLPESPKVANAVPIKIPL